MVVRRLTDSWQETKMFNTYAIYNSQNDKIYIGQTSDLEKRIESHNKKVGKHFTSKFKGEWKLIYSESFSTRSEAISREKQLKSSRGRDFIKNYIPG